MSADQHPAGKREPLRIELPVGQLSSYLVGVLGPSGVPVIVLEGSPAELATLFRVGLAALDRAELDAATARGKR